MWPCARATSKTSTDAQWLGPLVPSKEAQVSCYMLAELCLALRQYGVFFRKSVKKKLCCIFLWSPPTPHRAECLPLTRMNVVTPPSQKVAMSVWSESKIAVLFSFSQRTLQAAASAWTYLQPASFWLESRDLPLCSWGHTPRACTLPQVFLLPASLFLLNRRNTFCPSTLSLCPVLPLFS